MLALVTRPDWVFAGAPFEAPTCCAGLTQPPIAMLMTNKNRYFMLNNPLVGFPWLGCDGTTDKSGIVPDCRSENGLYLGQVGIVISPEILSELTATTHRWGQ